MIGFVLAIITFNLIAFTINKKLTKNQFVHIWMFTIVLQMAFDIFLGHYHEAYWYFEWEINWGYFFAILLLIAPVNIIFLNFYPYQSSLFK